jgi:hypothetical protein
LNAGHRRYGRLLIFLSLAATGNVTAQESRASFSVIARALYSTSAKLFLTPDSPNPVTRAYAEDFSHLTGGAVSFRLLLPGDDVFLSLTTGYISKMNESTGPVYNWSVDAPSTNGFRIYPAELTANIIVPVGWETFRFSFGGGVGIYYMERVLEVTGVAASTTQGATGFSLVVGSCAEYRIFNRAFVIFEMKALSPEASPTNKFEQTQVFYKGATRMLPSKEFTSKISAVGFTFGFGILVELF